jgi:hypothetical protein
MLMERQTAASREAKTMAAAREDIDLATKVHERC